LSFPQISGQSLDHEISPRRHAYLRQDHHLIAQRGINPQQALVFGLGFRQAMATLYVIFKNFGPGRREKDLGVEASSSPPRLQGRLISAGLQAGGGIDQAAIEENPALMPPGGFKVLKRHGDGATTESDGVNSRQGAAISSQLLFDDTTSRLLNRGEAPAAELGQEGGLAPARAAGEDDEAAHGL